MLTRQSAHFLALLQKAALTTTLPGQVDISKPSRRRKDNGLSLSRQN